MTLKEFSRLIARNKDTYSSNDFTILQGMIDNEFDIRNAGTLIEIEIYFGSLKRTYYIRKTNHIVVDDVSIILNLKYKKVVKKIKKLQEKKIKIVKEVRIVRGR
jgi:hypothetical protein